MIDKITVGLSDIHTVEKAGSNYSNVMTRIKCHAVAIEYSNVLRVLIARDSIVVVFSTLAGVSTIGTNQV